MKFLPIFFILAIACKSKNEKITSVDTTNKVSSPSDTSQKGLDLGCWDRGTYYEQSPAKEKEYKISLPNFAQLTSFKFFFKNKKKWDANKPLATALGLPEKAVIIEKAVLKGVKNREVILWMDNPGVDFSENTFSCPESTTGVGQFIGRVNISLINTASKKLLNTLVLRDYDNKTEECWRLPYLFDNENMSYYSFSSSGYKGFSKVTVLNFDDLDNDGLPHEFCFYSQDGCSMASKTLFSFDVKADSIFNYTVHLKHIEYEDAEKVDTIYYEKTPWVDIGFKFPSEHRPTEFALGIFMVLGKIINMGLPVIKIQLDKKERVIKGTWEFYPQDYVLKNDSLFNKYFPDAE